MQYMLLIYQSEGARQTATPGQRQEMFAAYGAYTEAMKKSGAFVAGDPLQPSSTATTVRVENGKNKVLNGPYAETKEQFGGYYISRRRISTPRSPGRRGARVPPSARSRCARS